MKSVVQKLALAVIAIVFALTSSTALGAAFIPEGINEQLSATVSPKVPGPSEFVSITVESFSTDLDAAVINWYVDGVLKVSKLGAKTFQFTTKPVGGTTRVSVRISKEEGGVVTKDFAFAPAEVDLIVEADTYVPPFYKGKAVYTHQSNYKVVAIPDFVASNGAQSSSASLDYKWSVNGTVDLANSGTGKDTYEGKGPLVSKPLEVRVEVRSAATGAEAHESIIFSPRQAELILYEENPLFGTMYEHALMGAYELDAEEILIKAIPLFASVGTADDVSLDYEWAMNGQELQAAPSQNTMQFRNVGNLSGESNINIVMRSVNNILTYAEDSITLVFNGDN